MQKNPLNLESVRQCERCAGLGDDHVPSWGSPVAELLVVGQSPGASEVEVGQPFIGPSGELLDFLLDEVGLTREEIYIANALKCRPAGNRAGLAGELSTCWNTWLHEEIKVVNPKVILVLGKDAWKSVIQERAPFKNDTTVNSKKRRFVISWHPSYYMRQGIEDRFVSDIGLRVKEALNG